MKKSVKIVAVAIGSLCLCWFIGQQFRVLRPELNPEKESGQEMTQQEQQIGNNEEEYLTDKSFHNLEFEGAEDTSDNPWSMTAGLFDMEDLGECIFLTPNTGVLLKDTGYRDAIELQYKIHPWVITSSDGAGLVVWVLDAQDNILYSEELKVSNQDEWQKMVLPLQEYETAVKVKIICNNGVKGDDSGDWVIIRLAQ